MVLSFLSLYYNARKGYVGSHYENPTRATMVDIVVFILVTWLSYKFLEIFVIEAASAVQFTTAYTCNASKAKFNYSPLLSLYALHSMFQSYISTNS